MGKSNETQVLSNAERQARFKANQAFKSLPPDVQHSIEQMSDTPEEKAQRTAIAFDYQVKMGKHPSTGIDCQLPKNSAKQCNTVLPRLEQPRQYPATCITGKVAV